MVNFILWAVLGIALSAAGVSVIDKPWQFFVIMFIVLGIDITSKHGV